MQGQHIAKMNSILSKAFRLIHAGSQIPLRLLSPFPLSCFFTEDVAGDLGFNFSNELSFREFVNYLTDPNHRPTKLIRFYAAVNKLIKSFAPPYAASFFTHHSLFSYTLMADGWSLYLILIHNPSTAALFAS